jgi:acyl carrier protein
MLLAAIGAARYGAAPGRALADAIVSGDGTARVDDLQFDSLAWMEFCISIELQSGQELTPAEVEQMQYLVEIDEWLRARL